jgi:hypothetical protein
MIQDLLGQTPDGRWIAAHDGITEWAICAECGGTLDGANPPPEARHDDWDGTCWHCGAPPERTGLPVEKPADPVPPAPAAAHPPCTAR